MQRIAVAVFLLVLCAQLAHGQVAGSATKAGVVGSEPINLGQELKFHSQILGRDLTLKIWLPDDFAVSTPDHRYPVVYINGMHGHQFFPTVAGMVRMLASRERMPESIVVSLSSMGEVPTVHTNGMWRAEILEGGNDPQLGLRHLEEELFPFLEREYRANDYRILIGVSGSCLFPIYTFTHAPGMFDSHVLLAAGDMVGMGYEAGKTFIETFGEVLAANPKQSTRLFAGVAGDDLKKREDYRENLDRLQQQLARHQNLDLKVEVFADTDHYAVLIPALSAALDQNFPKSRWSARYRDLVAQPGDALANIDQYYAELSQHYGFTILPRANRWNNVNSLRFMTRHLIREERPQEALAVARRRIQYRPQVPGAHAGLADALEANQQLEAAVDAQRKAVAFAKAEGEAERYEERLAELEAALEESGER